MRIGTRSVEALRSLLARGARRDTIWLLGAQSVALAATFAATPTELHRMGAQRYGIFVVLSTGAGFISVFDLGGAYSVMRFVPWHRARGDVAAAQSIVAAALLISVAIGVAVAVVLAALADPLTELLDISSRVRPDTVDAMRINAAFIPIILVSNVVSGLGRAVGMYALVGSVIAGQVTALNVVWVLVAGRPHDIVVLSTAQVAIGVAVIAISVVAIKLRHVSALHAVWPRRSSLREVGSFGTRTSVGQAALGLLTSADKPMLGAILPLSALPMYTIPFAFASRILMVPSSMSSAIVPPLAEAFAKGALDALVRLRQRAFAVVGLVSGLLAMDCVFGGKPLLALWIGHGFASRAWPTFAIFGVGFGVMACGFVGNVLLDAAGQPGIAAKVMGLGAVVGLASAALGAVVWNTPVAASAGLSVGLVVIGVGGVDRARRLAVPLSRVSVLRAAFNAWPPLAAAGGLSRAAFGVVGASSIVTLGAVVCATGSLALWLAYRSPAFSPGALRSRSAKVESGSGGT